MNLAHAIVAGAGLAGLSAAVVLAEAGVAVSLSDSAAQAGGRCRSYHDPALGLTIDNGNHLVLSGNAAVTAYRDQIGASTPLAGPDHADFAFADLASGARWTVRINDGSLPWWVLSRQHRVPGTRLADYIPLARLLRGRDEPIGEVVEPSGALWDRLLAPVLLAALNTPPAEASAALAARVLRETLGRGGLATRPRIAEPTLAAAFIDPALAWLEARGTRLAAGRRLRALEFSGDAVSALVWADGREEVAADEAVILAVPSWVALELVPGLDAPVEHRAIVNAHFAFAATPDMPQMLGLIGGTAEWVFAHQDRVSVTISAADALVQQDREELAKILWRDVQHALGVTAPLPAWQIVKEKRATFAATPAQDRLRPGARTRWRNLFLAGDWVQTGLPATIEGALRSGHTAARLALGRPLLY
ncbi:hydroxysqualene dehydroxylase HpnE [Novosphingobium sp. G106]|uniref:hydroxysqualene dehydroxylase HpnE n=1 Tax=Novosphingobium sp. G106 TaxID=2849500 RepID=UPI001C2DEDA1|nr:hydroxysqualene dehydroxylase HpnE [Novosphingobium sp. G106]MBV1688650.1 hydroxysqualene dehydroxylase HpnE [Novosphingobium sp. G106]